ncbi:unnamed protein product [Acanthoscelides obtectus]|uniref:Uncharacterized protein n=1 Tax=Acanthoscelides obtectus TaxID=200917 RepID=A0A9P0JP76_ACAOB|nr:unnamed protein product [Acanthoscelides obtectus]CAK1640239.1 hypothetical protein AOBTE_LOCUS11614 [Acanthoscelides obtectus]
MTNRIEGIEDFKHQLKYYGYRGESLASITECSKSVNITSRCCKVWRCFKQRTVYRFTDDFINL